MSVITGAHSVDYVMDREMVTVAGYNAGPGFEYRPGRDGICKYLPSMSFFCVKSICVCLLFRFVLSYGIVGKSGDALVHSSQTPVINLVLSLFGNGTICLY